MIGLQTVAAVHYRHPWLDRLTAEPDKAVDSLLRGVAHLPGLQRASPCEALMALMGDLPPESLEWPLLDLALCAWLQQRRKAADGLLARPGGVHRFIDETAEAFRAAWRLENLPESSSWITEHLLDLQRWAETFSAESTFDLSEAVLAAAAHLQRDRELRFLWYRVCDEAALPRLRHRLTIALLGLARMGTDGTQATGPGSDVVAGFARWASHLPTDDRHKSEVVREWRSIKATFPRQPSFWRQRWENFYNDHPFVRWLQEADPALKISPVGGAPKRAPQLPKDINETISKFKGVVGTEGVTEHSLLPIKIMLDQLEHYAEVSGVTFYLVGSCTKIANIILPQAPGHALSLARRALLWEPSNGHTWSVRAHALDRLGHPDLAQSVLWEGMRRAPSNAVFAVQLGALFIREELFAEAEALCRKAVALADNPVQLQRALFTFCEILIVNDRRVEAAENISRYTLKLGEDQWSTLLSNLLASGEAGRQNAREFMLKSSQSPDAATVPWDMDQAERVLDAELRDATTLRGIARVAKADFQLRSKSHRAEALEQINQAITDDDSDAYARVVKALEIDEYRVELEHHAGRFGGSLPVQLVLPSPQWHDLSGKFPEASSLINIVRLARGDGGDEVRNALTSWVLEPSHKKEDWEKFLKAEIGKNLRGETTSFDISNLAHDALTQAVGVAA